MSDQDTHGNTVRIGDETFSTGMLSTLQPLDERLMMTTGIVVAYVGAHPEMRLGELPSLIRDTYDALCECSGDVPVQMDEPAKSEPKSEAEIAASITPDALISFIDGKPYKTLKRHLNTYGSDPAEYRRYYGLPANYPLVCANYSAARSQLAKDLGLGRQRRKDRIKAVA